ncbi:MAG: hypothetical protein VB130_00520 [Clostridium sp.]|nr:hypothetical protein [Clostridium sp.]
MKKLNRKQLITLAIIFSALIVGIGVFSGTYYFFINKSHSSYKNKVNAEVANITKTNENSSNFTKGETIDTEKIINNLSDSITSLQTSLSKLKNLVVTNKYEKDHKNILDGLESNISIYKQIFTICKDSKSPNLGNYITQLQKYRDDCMNYYTLVSIEGIHLTLPKESIELIDNTISYAEKQIRLNADEKITLSQNHDFLKSLTDMLSKFNGIKKDYMPEVLDARSKTKGYDTILNDITSSEAVMTDIRSNASNISIPKDASSIYSAFIKVLDNYDFYIQSFKYAVKTESLTSTAGVEKDTSLDKLYSSSKDKLKTADDSFKDFMKLYNEFNDKISLQ